MTAMCMKLGRDNLNLVLGAAFGRVRSDSSHMQYFLIPTACSLAIPAKISGERKAVSIDAVMQACSDQME